MWKKGIGSIRKSTNLFRIHWITPFFVPFPAQEGVHSDASHAQSLCAIDLYSTARKTKCFYKKYLFSSMMPSFSILQKKKGTNKQMDWSLWWWGNTAVSNQIYTGGVHLLATLPAPAEVWHTQWHITQSSPGECASQRRHAWGSTQHALCHSAAPWTQKPAVSHTLLELPRVWAAADTSQVPPALSQNTSFRHPHFLTQLCLPFLHYKGEGCLFWAVSWGSSASQPYHPWN